LQPYHGCVILYIMFKKLYKYLETELQLKKSECMDGKQKVALKNIIEAARERVWLAEPLYPRLKTDGFTHDLPADTASTLIDSANILESYLNQLNKSKD